jgi:L-2-hydroxyglutarate oxidase LhgO
MYTVGAEMAETGCDYLVIGGGIIGLSLAVEIKRRQPGAAVCLIEKEPACGAHASGRNSGVLHAGFYYSTDSLKARFCREGNRYLTDYCVERGLRINRCGKLVVAKDESELPGLRELHRRGQANGVDVRLIGEAEARELEPRAKTCQEALWSPTTSSVDPAEVMAAFEKDARAGGVTVRTGCAYLGRDGKGVRTTLGRIEAGYVVNAAGLYADRIAKDYGFARRYRMLPFKGLYLYSDEAPGSLRRHIYPVPDLAFPFLGVHFTVMVDGKTEIGPTATPTFWREHYHGLSNFSPLEMAEVLWAEGWLFLRANFNFRGLAWEEVKKYRRKYLVSQAAKLLHGVHPKQYRHWGRPGIRAQLLDVAERKLIMDFCLEGDAESFHVLNAVSPAFTCSMPFARYVCDQMAGRRTNSTPRRGEHEGH